eukprot:scaffold4201_cov42-Prasinocladus_malaysianus.AAC.2
MFPAGRQIAMRSSAIPAWRKEVSPGEVLVRDVRLGQQHIGRFDCVWGEHTDYGEAVASEVSPLVAGAVAEGRHGLLVALGPAVASENHQGVRLANM